MMAISEVLRTMESQEMMKPGVVPRTIIQQNSPVGGLGLPMAKPTMMAKRLNVVRTESPMEPPTGLWMARGELEKGRAGMAELIYLAVILAVSVVVVVVVVVVAVSCLRQGRSHSRWPREQYHQGSGRSLALASWPT
jgi:hypothetical protein